jgi:hypothetical protein
VVVVGALLPAATAEGGCGLWEGLAGSAFVLQEAAKSTGDRRFAAGARYLESVAKTEGDVCLVTRATWRVRGGWSTTCSRARRPRPAG